MTEQRRPSPEDQERVNKLVRDWRPAPDVDRRESCLLTVLVYGFFLWLAIVGLNNLFGLLGHLGLWEVK